MNAFSEEEIMDYVTRVEQAVTDAGEESPDFVAEKKIDGKLIFVNNIKIAKNSKMVA